jgi:hypothetical protein
VDVTLSCSSRFDSQALQVLPLAGSKRLSHAGTRSTVNQKRSILKCYAHKRKRGHGESLHFLTPVRVALPNISQFGEITPYFLPSQGQSLGLFLGPVINTPSLLDATKQRIFQSTAALAFAGGFHL